MVTEYEIDIIIEIPEVKELIVALKESFLTHEAPLFEMNNHDFLALILLTPHVGVALSNGSVSLFEELSLNKKARKFSRGGTFLRKDPVVHAMNWLIKDYQIWEETFLTTLKQVMYLTFDKEHLKVEVQEDQNSENFDVILLKTPFIFVKLLKAFFLSEGDSITFERKISKVEYDKIVFLGNKLELDKYAIFRMFCNTFEVK